LLTESAPALCFHEHLHPFAFRCKRDLLYVIIVDPTRLAVGFWHRAGDGAWLGEMLTDEAAVIDMPNLGLAVPLASLYLRVRVEPQLRPRLVWGAAEPGSDPRSEWASVLFESPITPAIPGTPAPAARST
jgi:hypothetical protein